MAEQGEGQEVMNRVMEKISQMTELLQLPCTKLLLFTRSNILDSWSLTINREIHDSAFIESEMKSQRRGLWRRVQHAVKVHRFTCYECARGM